MSTKLTIEEVNALKPSEFVSLFKNAVELWPAAAESVLAKRPFNSCSELISYFVDYLEHLSENDKVGVLLSHPDLAGKLLHENKLSDESAAEQALAGLNKLTSDQTHQMIEFNGEYKKKFGFPFVICVRQNNKIEAILDGFRKRLPNTRPQEIINGIEQVKKICQLRIELIVNC